MDLHKGTRPREWMLSLFACFSFAFSWKCVFAWGIVIHGNESLKAFGRGRLVTLQNAVFCFFKRIVMGLFHRHGEKCLIRVTFDLLRP